MGDDGLADAVADLFLRFSRFIKGDGRFFDELLGPCLMFG